MYYKKGAQVIPGKVELAYYDLGGEGIAFHDTDAVNNGSGKLNYEQNCPSSGGVNPGDYVCHFREKDEWMFPIQRIWLILIIQTRTNQPVNQFYLGWEADGEWTNYTVNVRFAGRYRITALYGNNDNKSSLWINNKKAADIKLPSGTGSMHNWNKAEVGFITFTKTGLNLLTLYYNAGSNLAYFEFELIEEMK